MLPIYIYRSQVSICMKRACSSVLRKYTDEMNTHVAIGTKTRPNISKTRRAQSIWIVHFCDYFRTQTERTSATIWSELHWSQALWPTIIQHHWPYTQWSSTWPKTRLGCLIRWFAFCMAPSGMLRCRRSSRRSRWVGVRRWCATPPNLIAFHLRLIVYIFTVFDPNVTADMTNPDYVQVHEDYKNLVCFSIKFVVLFIITVYVFFKIVYCLFVALVRCINKVDLMLGSFMDELQISPYQFEVACLEGRQSGTSSAFSFHQGLFQQVGTDEWRTPNWFFSLCVFFS